MARSASFDSTQVSSWVGTQNDVLRTICAYWLDCIRSENVLEKDISLSVRKRAILAPLATDPFIFPTTDTDGGVPANEFAAFAKYAEDNRWDVFYGYPLLLYFDDVAQKHLVAPLFVLPVAFSGSDGARRLTAEDAVPSCGTQAFGRLGLRTEETADISQRVRDIWGDPQRPTGRELADKVFGIVAGETALNFQEMVEPSALACGKLAKTLPSGIYNRCLLFAGDPGAYNVHLLRDLEDLQAERRLSETALGFITAQEAAAPSPAEDVGSGPLLPYPADEYQIASIAEAMTSRLTVITGPPGTGKSQFITNLLVNLFDEGKSVLLVSHTNEAVDVVSSKLGADFPNLVFRTGRKELRQEVTGHLSELAEQARPRRPQKVTRQELVTQWQGMRDWRQTILKRDALEIDVAACLQRLEAFRDERARARTWWRRFSVGRKVRRAERQTGRVRDSLERMPSMRECETRISGLGTIYVDGSREYLAGSFAASMLTTGPGYGAASAFVKDVSATYLREGRPDEASCIRALQALPLWSSTLKSVGRSFPLSPGLFDFVVFDEASQVDLPSAAPALFRAKQAIIVGDPMQLTHIAGITRDVDKGLAAVHGLTRLERLYPHRTRYCDTSLYAAAANSLDHLPIQLSNHYRSEDSIIGLCNSVFYGGSLRTRTRMVETPLPKLLPLGVTWVDCKGEARKHPSGSRINQTEAEKAAAVTDWILKCIAKTRLTVGVVTPYSRQREALLAALKAKVTDFDKLQERHSIQVLTAHKYQGSEKDIMVFSPVVASKGDGSSDRWFDIYPQILNVALSRARWSLFIVGDRAYCKGRSGTLGKVVAELEAQKKQESLEESYFDGKFDSRAEMDFYTAMQTHDLASLGLQLKPKLVVKRYTLDFALLGRDRIDIEIDGKQHEIIGGLPIAEDAIRDQFLEREGWKVVRLPAHRVLADPQEAVKELLGSLSLDVEGSSPQVVASDPHMRPARTRSRKAPHHLSDIDTQEDARAVDGRRQQVLGGAGRADLPQASNDGQLLCESLERSAPPAPTVPSQGETSVTGADRGLLSSEEEVLHRQLLPVASLAAGWQSAAALGRDGALWTWGDNRAGTLGLDDTTSRLDPCQVLEGSSWLAVSAGIAHVLAIQSEGSLWAWGLNSDGQLGVGPYTVGGALLYPRPVPNADAERQTADAVARLAAEGYPAVDASSGVFDTDWVSVSAGSGHTLAIKSDGSLWAWGSNESGQLGLGDRVNRDLPTRVGPDTDWTAASAGSHSLALKADGSLWAWGASEDGRLGLGETSSTDTPLPVGGDFDWLTADAGVVSVARKQDGTLWAWGGNQYGQLGLGDHAARCVPTQVGGDDDWTAAATGTVETVLAVKSDGSLWAWGRNDFGGLGLGDTTARDLPARVPSAEDAVSVAVGGFFCLASDRDGDLWAWGRNDMGQLGIGQSFSDYAISRMMRSGLRTGS